MKRIEKVEPWFRDFDGWWYVTRRVNGKRTQIKLAQGKDNEPEARQQFHELMASWGSVRLPPSTSFFELAKAFLAWSKANNSAETTEWYHHYLSSFDDHYDGTVAELETHDVEAWLDSHTKWSQSTRRQAITCVKRAINWAFSKKVIPAMPEGIRDLKRPPMQSRKVLVSAKDHKRILKNTDKAFSTLLLALRQTGARPGEIRTVTAAMVDIKAGIWTLPKHKTVKKTDEPRIIYLTPDMVLLTKRLAKENPTGPLFRNARGQPWTSNAIRCRMRRMRDKLNLQDGTVAYAYRHTFTTDGLERGVPIAEMAELLGHVDTTMVSDHYAHLRQRKEHMRKAARKATKG